jgi:N-glycosylase/DNA lyase
LIAVRACEEANALMTAQLSNMMKIVPFISELTVKARRDLYHVMIDMIKELNHIFVAR